MFVKVVTCALVFHFLINNVIMETEHEQIRAHIKKLVANRTSNNSLSNNGLSNNNLSDNSLSNNLTSRAPTFPCECSNGECACCTGRILEIFNQKACMNVTYEPDDFAFTGAMSLNGRVLYKNKISGKNPPPFCVRVPRIRPVKLCARFSNLYFSGINMHTCIDIEVNVLEFSVYDQSFDCIRIGTNGVGFVPPEDGGGIAGGGFEEEEEDDDDFIYEDYDDSA